MDPQGREGAAASYGTKKNIKAPPRALRSCRGSGRRIIDKRSRLFTCPPWGTTRDKSQSAMRGSGRGVGPAGSARTQEAPSGTLELSGECWGWAAGSVTGRSAERLPAPPTHLGAGLDVSWHVWERTGGSGSQAPACGSGGHARAAAVVVALPGRLVPVPTGWRRRYDSVELVGRARLSMPCRPRQCVCAGSGSVQGRLTPHPRRRLARQQQEPFRSGRHYGSIIMWSTRRIRCSRSLLQGPDRQRL